MEVIHEQHGPVDVFRISGRLDYSSTAGEFDRKLRGPSERDPLRRFPVLEMSGVTMLGSQALRGVLALAKSLKGQSGLVFVAAPSAVAEEALDVSGFLQLKVFQKFATLEEAISAAAAAARTAPPLKTDDPFAVPPPPPPPPPAPTGLAAVVESLKSAAASAGKTWNAMAMKVQDAIDKTSKK